MLTDSCPNFGQSDLAKNLEIEDWNVFDLLKDLPQVKYEEGPTDASFTALNGDENIKEILSKSINWNHFFKQSLISLSDTLRSVINKFNEERQDHLELQLAYDQRTREWSQQQEQLICMLLEIQPLRERVKIAEVLAEKELQSRLKHEAIEESLRITINQMSAKIGILHSKVNPGFVARVEKKLRETKQCCKKLKIDLQDASIDVTNLRTYISTHHAHLENTNKKLFWALKMAKKSNMIKHKLTKNETENVDEAYCEVQSNLRTHYASFMKEERHRLAGRKLELTLIPKFDSWLNDYKEIIEKQETSKSDVELEIDQLQRLFSEIAPNQQLKSVRKEVRNRKREPRRVIKRRRSHKENEAIEEEEKNCPKPKSPKFKVPAPKVLKTFDKKRNFSDDLSYGTKRRRTLKEIGLELSDESEIEDDVKSKRSSLFGFASCGLSNEKKVDSQYPSLHEDEILPDLTLADRCKGQHRRDLNMIRNIVLELNVSSLGVQGWQSDLSDLEEDTSSFNRVKRMNSTGFKPQICGALSPSTQPTLINTCNIIKREHSPHHTIDTEHRRENLVIETHEPNENDCRMKLRSFSQNQTDDENGPLTRSTRLMNNKLNVETNGYAKELESNFENDCKKTRSGKSFSDENEENLVPSLVKNEMKSESFNQKTQFNGLEINGDYIDSSNKRAMSYDSKIVAGEIDAVINGIKCQNSGRFLRNRLEKHSKSSITNDCPRTRSASKLNSQRSKEEMQRLKIKSNDKFCDTEIREGEMNGFNFEEKIDLFKKLTELSRNESDLNEILFKSREESSAIEDIQPPSCSSVSELSSLSDEDDKLLTLKSHPPLGDRTTSGSIPILCHSTPCKSPIQKEASVVSPNVEERSFFREMDISTESIDASLNAQNHYASFLLLKNECKLSTIPESNDSDVNLQDESHSVINFYCRKTKETQESSAALPICAEPEPIAGNIPHVENDPLPIFSHPFDTITNLREKSFKNELLENTVSILLSAETVIDSFAWRKCLNKLHREILSQDQPNITSKLQPLVRCFVMNILNFEVLPQEYGNVTLRTNEVKCLLEISKQLNRPFMLGNSIPKFFIDNLVNSSIHQLIVTRTLRPSSLAAVTCWFLSSIRRQNVVNDDTDDNPRLVDCSRAFLVDIMTSHAGLCHKALLVAVKFTKLNFHSTKWPRSQSVWEQLLLWIAHHGSWIGSDAIRIQLVKALATNLQSTSVPPIDLQCVFQKLLKDILEFPSDKLCLEALIVVLLHWSSYSSIMDSLIPILKNLRMQVANFSSKSIRESLGKILEKTNWSSKQRIEIIQKIDSFS